jgi:BMFP domain-containing protein YqiC
MQSENRFFDDVVKLINGAAGTLAGVGREAEAATREKAKEWIGGLEFVSREEFEAVKAIAVAARNEVDALTARLDALEGKKPKPAAASAPKAAKPAAKATAKPATKAAGKPAVKRTPKPKK